MEGIVQNAGVYHATAAALLRGTTLRVLPHAVQLPQDLASFPSDKHPHQNAYGLVKGCLNAPSRKDYYIVEFVGKRAFRLLAYLDAYGRVFSTDKPLSAPPARSPQVQFSDFSRRFNQSEQRGFVQVQDEKGELRQLAQYSHTRTSYKLFGSWYNFGQYASGLSYADALARAYFALLFRPQVLGTPIPACGTKMVHDHLRKQFLLPAVRNIVNDVRSFQGDQMVTPPALVRCLVRWLCDAGVGNATIDKAEDDSLGLAHTLNYAKLYFVTEAKSSSELTRQFTWALESALNRFLLLEQRIGDNLDETDEISCARMEAALFESVDQQPYDPSSAPVLPVGATGGEWEVRCNIAAGIERLRLPVRVEVVWRADVEKGVVAFDILGPGPSLMPTSQASSGHNCVSDTSVYAGRKQPEDQARDYALRVGLALAAIAFKASSKVERVVLGAHLLPEEEPKPSHDQGLLQVAEPNSAEFPDDQVKSCYSVTFSKRDYELSEGFKLAPLDDPLVFFTGSDARLDPEEPEVFSSVRALPSFLLRNELPESFNKKLPENVCRTLGASDASDMSIVYHASLRHLGEDLADKLVLAQSASEAIRFVRESQETALSSKDDSVVMACTRLMAALAKGEIDTGDQNAVVGCFLGEDRCMSALNHAKTMVDNDLAGAVAVLSEALNTTVSIEGFEDSQSTVYRTFDSYASRVLYNCALSRAQLQQNQPSEYSFANVSFDTSLSARVRADAGKKVLLVPDSFYLCHLELTNLLGRSFDHADEALVYGRRAVQMAPTVTASYRQLARVYVLVGDMDSAIEALTSCLRVATQQSDIAVAYYQLAYALWKAGDSQAGATCYLKSITTSPVMALQAMAELKELVFEQGIDLADREAVDEVLSKQGILIAPTKEVLDILEAAAVSAVDTGLFPVARNVLSLWLQYRPDDALTNVLRSLNA